jgi:hypothetical protein
MFICASKYLATSDGEYGKYLPPAVIPIVHQQAHTQPAGDDREDLLLPLVATFAQSARKQHAMCIDLVEYFVSTAGSGGHD